MISKRMRGLHGGPRWVLAPALAAVLASLAGPAAAQTPALVAVTLDTSGSIRPEVLAATRDLSLAILQALPPGSEVALFTFDDESRLLLERSADPEAVRQALEGVTRAGRFTALHDAIYDASRYLAAAPPSRKAIVLITDGKDENSALNLEDGLKVAVENKIPVFAVGVGRVQESVLRRIAKLSAGEYKRLGETSGEEIARRVAELPLPTSPPATAPPAAARPVPLPAGQRAALWSPLQVAGIVFAGLCVMGAAYFFYRSRQHVPQTAAGPGSDEEDEEVEGAKDDATVVMRTPGAAPVDKTVMLRFRPALTVTGGPLEGKVFRLSEESALSIGRAPTNDVSVPDTSVSSEHCRVRPEGGIFVVHDLKSTNGTFVNGRRVKRHALIEGDEVRVGETVLLFRMDQA